MRFDTLLIANRGEIACRIIRSARQAGLRTVAVYSDADEQAAHVLAADQAIRVGQAAPTDSYLNVEHIIDAARWVDAQAIHPGYGFLSESADFVRACEQAGLVFVGPSAAAIDALGNKTAAKHLAKRLGVPCLAGADEREPQGSTLADRIGEVGLPLMIKAAAGGGGRGMRRVERAEDFAAQLQSARAEARAAFGNDEMLIEQLLSDARHVEVQIIGDEYGNMLHLGERDCSTQRRSQKLIEEAPAPGLTDALRTQLGEAAVRMATGVSYHNAGTVEFLLTPSGEFYFLEMNTRLQVEHPVTEAVTGIDLVALQLRVAQGEALALRQQDIRLTGCAIEARLCAEDPARDFAPQPGPIAAWHMPDGPGVRCEHGLGENASIPAHYDSMIAKLIVHAPNRELARKSLCAALERTTIHGPSTNRGMLLSCLRAPEFSTPALRVDWLDRSKIAERPAEPPPAWLALAAVLLVEHRARVHGRLAHWRSGGPDWISVMLTTGAESIHIGLRHLGQTRWQANSHGQALELDLLAGSRVRIDQIDHWYDTLINDHNGSLDAMGYLASFSDVGFDLAPNDAPTSGELTAGMHGMLAAVHVTAGSAVKRGAPLFSIEAMKMTHRTDSPIDAQVAEILVRAGEQVKPEQLIIKLAAVPAESPTRESGDNS